MNWKSDTLGQDLMSIYEQPVIMSGLNSVCYGLNNQCSKLTQTECLCQETLLTD